MNKTTEALKLGLETAEAIVAANWKTWEELATPEEFERWAKSRANHMVAAIREDEREKQQEPVAMIEVFSGWEDRYQLDIFDRRAKELPDGKYKLYTTPPSTAQEPRNFGIEMLKQYERGVKAGGCIAARQMRDAAVKALADEEKRVQGLYEQYKTGSPKHEFGVGMWNGLTLASQTIAALPILGEENV